jgi:colanic acid/amylovoran biosynthesis glycosyltransferase
LALDLSLLAHSKPTDGGSGNTCEILSVGRLIPKKGMDILIRAAALLRSGPSFRMRIVGDGPLRSELEALARRLKLDDRIFFLGWQTREETYRLMHDSQVFVLASRTDGETKETEGAPMVLLEAQATGLPVVSTFHADIPHIIRPDESGFLVPEAEPEALAQSIGRLISDPELRISMGRNGRRHVEDNHDMKSVGPRLENLYRKVISAT